MHFLELTLTTGNPIQANIKQIETICPTEDLRHTEIRFKSQGNFLVTEKYHDIILTLANIEFFSRDIFFHQMEIGPR